MDDDFARAFGFESDMRERCSTRSEPFLWGTALFNSDFPKVYDMNYIRVDTDLSSASAPALIEEGDRLLGAAGYDHRQLEMVDSEGQIARLSPGFGEAGWEVFRALYMALRREPDRSAEPGVASEVTWEDLRPTVVLQTQREPFATSEELVRQLADRRSVLATQTDLRHFGARVDGRIVSYCDLYSDGRTAQVEEVATLEEFRNRGLARATIETAVGTALAEGHDFVFLVADEDDWPKALYSRLGFDAVGVMHSFRKYPKPVGLG